MWFAIAVCCLLCGLGGYAYIRYRSRSREVRTIEFIKSTLNVNDLSRFKINDFVFSVIVHKSMVRIARYCDFSSEYSVYVSENDQIAEGSAIILKGSRKSLIADGVGGIKIASWLREKGNIEEFIKCLSQMSQYGNVAYAGLNFITAESLNYSITLLSGLCKHMKPSETISVVTIRQEVGKLYFSCCVDSPLLNGFVINIIGEDVIPVFKKSVDQTTVADVFEYEFDKGVFRNYSSDLIVSLDQVDEGSFICFVKPASGYEEEIAGLIKETPDYMLVDKLIENIGKIELMCRRLYDWEMSWYSGEYEIMGGEEYIIAIKNKLASSAVKLIEIDKPFNKKILKDDVFIRSN